MDRFSFRYRYRYIYRYHVDIDMDTDIGIDIDIHIYIYVYIERFRFNSATSDYLLVYYLATIIPTMFVDYPISGIYNPIKLPPQENRLDNVHTREDAKRKWHFTSFSRVLSPSLSLSLSNFRSPSINLSACPLRGVSM